ncbi:MAG: putative lysine decarboxylase [Acidobacteria bacterium]|nr:putative lysine decarboxylase [Acidobacteriota bacterium]
MNTQPLAYLSREFLESDAGRPLRILSEYLEPLRRFGEERIQDTVVFFGSARTPSRSRAEAALAALGGRDAGSRRGPDEALVAQARRALDWSRYYEDARILARRLATWSRSLDSPFHRFVVCSGGGPGIMEAANRGAREGGGKTIGLNIRLPFEQGPNAYISPRLHFEFHYFFMRKFWFAYLAKALVVFPGGFGTLDELFEILTLVQTQKLSKRIGVILYGKSYWSRVLQFDPMIEAGAISPQDLQLFTRADSPDEAFECLRDHLTEHVLRGEQPEDHKAPTITPTRA